MSRLRISDPQSILNVMRDTGPSPARVRRLEIRTSPEHGRSHPLEAELREPAEGDAGAPDGERSTDDGLADDVAEPERGTLPA